MLESLNSKLKGLSEGGKKTVQRVTFLVTDTGWLLPLLAATLWGIATLLFYFDNYRLAVILFVLGLVALGGMFLLIAVPKGISHDQSAARLDTVLNEERAQIDRARNERARGQGGAQPPHVGLALSGGGIRSATFNLGLIQALADLHLLSRIDYLSTVSGGGYIGSWLMQWVRRVHPVSPVAGCDDDSSDEATDSSRVAPAGRGHIADPTLAGLLYVAWADGKLSESDLEVLERAAEATPGQGPTDPSVPAPSERRAWLDLVAATNGKLSQHAKAKLAAHARRIVNAHRDSIELQSRKVGGGAETPAAGARRDALEKQLEALARLECVLELRGIDKIEHYLADEASVACPEPRPVAHLREFSNYLTPKVGLLTADTWTTVATYIRNFVINLVLITATGSVLLLLPRFIRLLGAWADVMASRLAGDARFAGYLLADHWSLAVTVLLATFAVLWMADCLRQAALDLDHGRSWRTSQGSVQSLIVMPLVLASLFAAHWLGGAAGKGEHLARWAALAGAAYAAPWLIFGWWSALFRRAHPSAALNRWTLANSVLALAGVVVGASGGALAYKLKSLWAGDGLDSWAGLTIGPPLIMSAFTLSAVLLIGLAGRRLDDYLREWLARVGAWVTIYSLAWLALVGLATYGPVLLVAAAQGGRWLLASGWLAASIGGVLAGNARQQGAKKGWHGPVIKLAPWIFILGLVLLLTWGLDAGLSRQNGDVQARWNGFVASGKIDRGTETLEYKGDRTRWRVERSQHSGGWLDGLKREHDRLLDDQLGLPIERSNRESQWQPGVVLIAWIVGLGLISVVFGWRVDINEFSMHNYYRNRLARAYLGASNPDRLKKTQPFTGMARSDDSELGTPIQESAGGRGCAECYRPYHLVNTALNLVGGDRLAWQQRKAASFVLSPLYSGFELPPTEGTHGREAAFRRTSDLEGLTVGTALAISGAAASPNMGFHSSPALTLLLTVFNVRLGWWLGNPKSPRTWSRLTPLFALKPLLAELFGLTSLDSNYVYLSDGGHFENLGIYELVRRRCRFIIASDVAADPNLEFEDLGNAIRKCRNDFGAQIEINVDTLRSDANGISQRHCVVGRITYAPENEGDLPDRGWLLFIKASLTGDEAGDVLQYRKTHSAFPHQSTIDQFFDEPQFESYRRLGRHIGHSAFKSSSKEIGEDFKNWYSLFDDLNQRWYAPSAAVEMSFAKHGQALDELFERLRREPKLQFLDRQIYRELGESTVKGEPTLALPSKRSERRAGFYFCLSLLQLMENVYLDLKLDDEHAHPDNRGWLNLFQRWCRVPMMAATWAVSAGTFGARFQKFCQLRLALPRSEVKIGEPLDKTTIETLASRLGSLGEAIQKTSETEKVTWHQLVAAAPDLEFPIGLVVLRHAEASELSELIYYEVDAHLRDSGLAQDGLRSLRWHLDAKGANLGGGRLVLVASVNRLRGIDAAAWRAFEHFYNGALRGH